MDKLLLLITVIPLLWLTCQAQQSPSPSPSTSSGQCSGGYLVQGTMAGPPGPQGPAGRDGLTITGKAGKDGRDGIPGRDGSPGPAGKNGRDGNSGPAGKNGRDGNLGRDGQSGLPGAAGPPGAAGTPGASGVDLDELRQIVRMIAREEIKNVSAVSLSKAPVNVVVKHDQVCGPQTPTTASPTNNPLTPAPPTTSQPQPPRTQPPTARPTYKSNNRSCGFGLRFDDPADSCHSIHLCNTNLASGWYWIKMRRRPNRNYALTRVYCQMEENECGLSGLTRVALLDMTDSSQTCPYPLQETTQSNVRMCTSPRRGAAVSSITFDAFHLNYNFVCGRAVGYDYYGGGQAYYFHSTDTYPTIDTPYMSGLSFTYKTTEKRQHIWSLGVGSLDPGDSNKYHCPCAGKSTHNPPYFVGNDQYCESGAHTSHSDKWYMDNPLWDGKGCHSTSRCCDNSRMPWFWRILSDSTSSDIEVRWMRPVGSTSYNFGISLLEIYIR